MIKTSVTIFFVLLTICCSCQDEQFSQFYAIPIHINPALTGAYNGTYRMTMIYRDQWSSSLQSPYKTFAAGGDTNFKMKFGKLKTNDNFGIGLFFVSDRVAEFQMNTNKISGYLAYHKSLSDRKKSFLGVGAKFGIIQRNINYDNLNFQDQFNQINAFDSPTMENLPPNNIGVMDLSVGINYFIELDKTTYYAGLALHHLNQPNISFFKRIDNPNPAIDITQVLANKLVAHFSFDKKLSYQLSLQPRIVYQKQSEDNQLNIGSNIEYTFEDQQTSLIFGAWIKMIDDLDGPHLENVTPLFGIRKGLFIVGVSYDIHLRDTFSSTYGLNTFELSMRFSGIHSNENSFCPTF